MLNKGDKIGGYTLIKKVGSGGFGDVWKAEKRTVLDVNYFALKFFRPKDERIDFEKITKELAVWKQLRGLPHIISVIELDRFDDYIYIVSDFADGGSLDNWIKDNDGKASSEAEATKIALEILTGLENLHEKGFVHRDIKPDNILIMNGKHCLADFGVSREIKTHSKATGTAGTYEYMPPEAFGKNPSVPPQTDIWAVGVILQQLLTGELPFSEEMPALMFSILQEPPEEMPENISEGLREIVKTALQKDREKRFQTSREMREALRNPKQFLAAKAKKEKDSGTIVDEDFDKDREIEAEKQRREEQSRIERETEEKRKQQEIAEQEREKLLREMEVEKERQRLKDADAVRQEPEKPSVASNSDSPETSNSDILEKQNNVIALFNLGNKQLSVVIPISMWVLVGIISGIISSRFLTDSDFKGNSNLLINLLFIGFTFGLALYLFGEFSDFRSIRIKGKFFTSVFLTLANAIGCFAAFHLSTYTEFISPLVFGIIWGTFFVAVELLCWRIKLNKLIYAISIIIFAGISSWGALGLAFVIQHSAPNTLDVWLFWRIVLGQTLALLGHAIIFALIKKRELRDEFGNAADGSKSEPTAFRPPNEKNAIGAIGGIGGVLLILIFVALITNSSSVISNSNSNVNTQSNRAVNNKSANRPPANMGNTPSNVPSTNMGTPITNTATNSGDVSLASCKVGDTGTITGGNLRSSPYFYDDDNILSTWDPGGKAEILSITKGQASRKKGTEVWYKVKIKYANCPPDSNPESGCAERNEGYMNADLVYCN